MHLKRIYFLIFFCLGSLFGISQHRPCQMSPFPCMEDNMAQARNESQRLINFLNVPEELKMEFKCRAAALEALSAFVEEWHWSYYQVDESADAPKPVDCNDPRAKMLKTDAGYDPDRMCGVKYELRPPHQKEMKFIIVVNQDSLDRWNQWRKDTLLRETELVGDDATNMLTKVSENPKLKTLSDSLDFYTKNSVLFDEKYLTQYMKDLVDSNRKGIKFYEEKKSFLEKKADFFRNKYDEQAEIASSGSAAHFNEFYYKNALKDSRYIEGAVFIITFRFNFLQSFSANNVYSSGDAYQGISYNKPAGAAHTFLYRAKIFPVEPDAQHYDFDRPSCMTSILFGAWIAEKKSDPYVYSAAFVLNADATDNAHVKKIPCDEVQIMEVVVQGRRDYVDKCLGGFNFAQLFSSVRQ